MKTHARNHAAVAWRSPPCGLTIHHLRHVPNSAGGFAHCQRCLDSWRCFPSRRNASKSPTHAVKRTHTRQRVHPFLTTAGRSVGDDVFLLDRTSARTAALAGVGVGGWFGAHLTCRAGVRGPRADATPSPVSQTDGWVHFSPRQVAGRVAGGLASRQGRHSGLRDGKMVLSARRRPPCVALLLPICAPFRPVSSVAVRMGARLM